MKKFLVSVLAIAGLVACNNEQTIVQQGPAPMEFAGAFVENATRAIDPSITTASLNAFDVWAYVEEKAGTVLTKERVTRVDDTKWTYYNKQYWTPKHNYYFTAIAPVDTNHWTYNQAEDKLYFSNDVVAGAEDLLYAYEKVSTHGTEIGQAMSAVALQFEHLLSKVNFKFKNGFATDNVSIVVSNVQMTAPKAGTYCIHGAGENDTTTGEWILGEGSVDLIFGDVEQLSNGASASAANERLTIPASAQQSYTVSFTIELYNGTVLVHTFDKVSTITGVELEKGKAYNFVAEITPENLELTSIEFALEEVLGWDQNQSNSLEASLRLAAELGGKVTLTDDVVLDQPLVVSGANTRASHTAVNLEIDLNGKSISYTSDVAASSAMIAVESGNTLVIKDTVGGGKISYNYTGAGDPTFGWGTYTISNNGGTLVIENGTIEMLSDIAFAKHMDCAVFQYSGSTTINGGKISTPNYRSARLWKGDMTINGGEFEGQLWVQAVDNSAELTINGGSFAPCGGDYSSVFVENSTYTVTLSVTGGTFATKLGCSNFAKDGVKGSVTGGVFGEEPNANLLAEGYYVTEVDGKYVVADAFLVYSAEQLKEAVANKVKAINISGEIDLANVVLSGYNGTIVGESDAVLNTRHFVPSADEAYQLRSQNLTIKNCTIKVPTEDGDFLKTGFVGTGVIVFENCKFEGQVTLNGSANWTFNDCEFASIENGAYASFVYGATKATFNNCSFRGVDRAAKIYGTGGTLNVEYNNCTYTSATLNKAGVEIDATYAETTVVLKGCSQTAMKDLYALKGAKGSVTVL